jgi:plastocyanin
LNELLRKNQTLIKLIEYEQQTENIANIHTDILYNRINDLVERRNEIAHGSETLNIFSLSELEPYIEFLEKYCQAIFEVLVDQFIKQKSIYKFQKIEKVVKIFNNEILAFEVADYTIKVGDTLIIETKEGQFHEKTIDSIELDNESYQELIISEKKNIAISVAFRINKNQTFYVVNK